MRLTCGRILLLWTKALPYIKISLVECSRFMARRVGGGEEGSVKAAEGAEERSKQGGQP